MWALLLGSITAITQFFLGDFVSPGGFGFSRFLFGFIEITSLPVLIPLIFYLIILIFKRFSEEMDFVNFALLWLIPVAALRALSWSSTNDPILLIMAPLLWTALAVGIPFFINLMINNLRWYIIAVSVLCILIMPVLACIVYWAFFSQQELLGYTLLIVTHIPMGFSFFFGIRGA